MKENIIQQIKEAEEKAAARKAEAEQRAAVILTEAEQRAAEICKNAQNDCAKYRAEALARAEKTAQEEFEKTLSDARTAAKQYADGILEQAEVYVSEILGRIVK